ncbi:MAG: Crp/Fnr family transcriptional regulator [Rhodospirillales bacterium]
MLQINHCETFATTRDPSADDRSLLSGIALFADFDRARLTAIEQACRYKRFAAQEQIIDRDSATTDVFFVVRGRVRVVNYSILGREIALDEVSAGHYFGELSALDGRPRSAGVMAVEDTLILALPRRPFLDLLADHPDIALRVMVRMAGIIRAADDRIMDLSTLAAQNRVHAELLRQARPYRSGGRTAKIEPVPVHSDIASRVSTSRETVARVLGDLARRGIVERTRDALVIHDLGRLRNMVQDVRG